MDKEAKNKMETELTIEQYLENLGMAFRSLSLHSDGRWIAKAGHKSLPTKQLFNGKTPQEALGKLLAKVVLSQPVIGQYLGCEKKN